MSNASNELIKMAARDLALEEAAQLVDDDSEPGLAQDIRERESRSFREAAHARGVHGTLCLCLQADETEPRDTGMPDPWGDQSIATKEIQTLKRELAELQVHASMQSQEYAELRGKVRESLKPVWASNPMVGDDEIVIAAKRVADIASQGRAIAEAMPTELEPGERVVTADEAEVLNRLRTTVRGEAVAEGRQPPIRPERGNG